MHLAATTYSLTTTERYLGIDQDLQDAPPLGLCTTEGVGPLHDGAAQDQFVQALPPGVLIGKIRQYDRANVKPELCKKDRLPSADLDSPGHEHKPEARVLGVDSG